MCGITGLMESAPGDEAALRRRVTRMAEAIQHRGPDDAGTLIDAPSGLAIAHRRLSILDLSPAGHQPMRSATGRFHIVFNGEIYNFAPLRRELIVAGATFRGGSDTEVLIAAMERWGIEPTLKRLVGMFAFAVWDAEERKLVLARDRMGEKPLYYGWLKQGFVFGSELTALRAHPGWHAELNRAALATQMQLGYVPAPHSIYEGFYKLPPGCWMTLAADAAHKPHSFSPDPDDNSARVRPRRYWSLAALAMQRHREMESLDPVSLANELERRLRTAVRDQMIADVPLGAFLSGGIDSSLVVALMQAESPRPVRTFTIGFDDRQFNEAHHAAAVAHHLGTDHTEIYLGESALLDTVPRLASIYDEPFADASMLPTALICQMARQHVKVCLTGDGGDELFGGYNRYRWTNKLWRATAWMPRAARTAIAKGLRTIPPAWLDGIAEGHRVEDGPARPTSPGHRLQKVAHLLSGIDRASAYRAAVAYWGDGLVSGAAAPVALTADSYFQPKRSYMDQMMLWDTLVYLPDDNLVKVDRAAMSVALETRVPLLDHRIVEFAWRLPLKMKITSEQGKHLLREVLHRHVPSSLMARPKMGFSVPVGRWLCGPLRDWAESLLNEERLRREGLFDAALVSHAWQSHLSGRANHQAQLWAVLMFQAWNEGQRATHAVQEEHGPLHRSLKKQK